MSTSPYADLPDHAFWARAQRVDHPRDLDPVISAPFQISPETKIATAGSCFAQHIAQAVQKAGYSYHVTEPAHPILSREVAQAHGYGTFSARYGNIYTVRQLWQLVQRAYGLFYPVDDVWETEDGRLIDPFRPRIQPGGFLNRAEFETERARHFSAVRALIETSDLFIFTMGLTEAWESRADGAVYPLAPGVAGGTFDPKHHQFVNFNVDETIADFRSFADFARTKNPALKLLLTVSPVPLVATAQAAKSVITATSYSKAVLRVAAEALSTTLPDCAYFPSYEVITGHYGGGGYYMPDRRSVRPEGVAHVMSLFFRHYTEDGTKTPSTQANAPDFVTQNAEALAVICDEEMNAQSTEATPC